ncbi:mucin-5AC-like [Anopheles cruzii]|uniref:mucin-5AC-like n=1 Tax=Anopheles cruzii TaxID=68878 RepID=UPI0022EC4D45|nr:mucin-5AC-like [Anopheles cruzii]
MKRAATFVCILAVVAILAPGGLCVNSAEQELVLRRNRRTVQLLVDHFANFFRLSAGGSAAPKKAVSKQDHAPVASPLTSILKASSGKLSSFSGHKTNAVESNREPTLQHDLPTWIEDRPQKVANSFSEPLEIEDLVPTRVSLLSTTREPEQTTTTTTEAPITTTTAEPTTTNPPAQPTELADEAETADATTASSGLTENGPTSSESASPQEESDEGATTEPAAIDPADVNGLSSRNDVRDESFQPTPAPLVSYQHYVHTGSWPGSHFQNPYPMLQYFGNNVFFPGHAQFPLAAPFQAQPVQALPQNQGYLTSQPLYDNRLHYPTGTAAQPQSHSRVKLHDNHYDLVTYHDDTETAASNYQSQAFGNFRARRY